LQPPSYLCLLDIGAADMVAEVEQDLGNPAHANPAYAYKMDMLDFSSSIHPQLPVSLVSLAYLVSLVN